MFEIFNQPPPSFLITLALILSLISLGIGLYKQYQKAEAKREARKKLDMVCSQFKSMGFTVDVYEPLDERNNFWLVKISKGEEIVEEKKIPMTESGRETENILKLANVLNKLLPEFQ